MKNFYTLLLLVLATTISCQKEKDFTQLPNNFEQTYKVEFTTSFDQSVDDFKSTSPSKVSDHNPNSNHGGDRIYNLDNAGRRVYDWNKLAPGNYVAVFLKGDFYRMGGIGGDQENSNGGDIYYNAFFDTRPSTHFFDSPPSDIFYKKIFFTVTNKDIKQNVVLERIVAGFELELQDEPVPYSVSIKITIPDVFGYSIKSVSLPMGGDKPAISFHSWGNDQRLMTRFVLGSGQKPVLIEAFNEKGGLLAKKTVVANFFPNKKTRLTGKLFSGGDFKISVNDQWDTPPASIPF